MAGLCPLIDLIAMELETVELKDDNPPIKPYETEVGELTDHQKRLQSLAGVVGKEMEACKGIMLKEFLKLGITKDEARHGRKVVQKWEMLQVILWNSIMDSLDLYHANVGIRAGWKIVTYEDEDSPWGESGKTIPDPRELIFPPN